MRRSTPIAVCIPTYNRGRAVFETLDRIDECNPRPIATLVHIDKPDGVLEAELRRRFPQVKVLTSPTRLGPGGGRHRCLLACNTPYAVSFDDDSYPVDADFFGRVEQLFRDYPNAAIFGARIWHKNEPEKARTESVNLVAEYIGCGFAIRLKAYNDMRGLLPRTVPYGMEETDLSLQLFAAGWQIYEAGDLRVFHDTDLSHHKSAEINAGTITNTGLFAFLHFPVTSWGWGLQSVANRILYCVRMGRLRGVLTGLLRIPVDCYRCRHYRNAIDRTVLKEFLALRRTGPQATIALGVQDTKSTS